MQLLFQTVNGAIVKVCGIPGAGKDIKLASNPVNTPLQVDHQKTSKLF
jgi:hypothetical protein